MIRGVASTEEGHAVYGFTIRGVAVLGAVLGITCTAVVLSVIALSLAHTVASNRILVTCEEANRRHREAVPQVIALVRVIPQKDPAIREAQGEALFALEHPLAPPTTQAGKLALTQINRFVQVLAPAYDCKQRVEKLTKP